MRKRIGATVIAPDGEPSLLWGYTTETRRSPSTFDADTGCCTSHGRVLGVTHTAWLWRDGALTGVTEAASRRLEVVGVHSIYQKGQTTC